MVLSDEDQEKFGRFHEIDKNNHIGHRSNKAESGSIPRDLFTAFVFQYCQDYKCCSSHPSSNVIEFND